MKYGLLIIFLISTNTLALTEHQKYVKEVARKIGSNTCVHGMCFGKTLQAIAWQESSFGIMILGDKGNTLDKSSLGPFQIRLATAKYTIKKQKLKKFYYLIDEDQLLINRLLSDVEFGATISANYLAINYKRALRNKRENPWFYCVSKYNGGSNNTTYVNRITDKLAKL